MILTEPKIVLKTVLYITAFFCCGFSIAQTTGQSVTQNDFAFGHPIEITDKKSVIEITLPEEAYSISKNPQMQDIAVFNGAGEAVPHAFFFPEAKSVETVNPDKTLGLFPVYENANQPDPLQNIRIATDRNGAIVEITGQKKSKSNQSIAGYILDASKIKNPISQFQIHYTELPKNNILKLKLEGSNDLKNWNVVESEAVVAWFEMGGEKIIQDQISNSLTNFKFYKISSSYGDALPTIKDIAAQFSGTTEFQSEAFNSKKVIGKSAGDSQNELVNIYDLNGSFPVMGINIKFKDTNSIARIAIEAAHSEKGPWKAVSEGIFFSVSKDGKAFEKLNINFETVKFQFWKLKLVSDKSGMGSQFPEVTFNWRPHKLQFLARGSEPFTLAYGSSKAKTLQNAELISFSGKESGHGQIKAQVTFGGPGQLIIEEKNEINYKKYILWAVLLLGVLVIGTMALQVNKNTST